MFHSYNLKSTVWHEKPIVFEWDPDAGAIRGPDAERVMALVNMAVSDGSVESHPFPTSYDIQDPLRRPDEMAAILALFWELPSSLAEYLRPADPSPEYALS